MTQRRNTRISTQSSVQRSLLVRGIGWLGGLGILSSSMVTFAQTPDASEVIVPSAQDLLMPAESSPQSVPPAPVVVEPEPAPAPVVTQPPAASPAPSSSPSQASSQPAPDASTIVVPGLSSDTPITADSLSPSNLSPSNSAPAVEQNSYIDSTEYSIGATQGYEQPAVVFSERSTGCQATVASGQNVPASICNSQTVAASQSGDRTLRLGPVSIGPSGVTIGGTTPSGREYFSRTIRPSALPGNGNVSLMFPLSIPSVITSAFGWRLHPISGGYRLHQGTDIGAPMGTPVVAAYTGKVAIANFMGGYGLTVVMSHGDETIETLYAHMSELFVEPGEWVEQGEVIGRVGSTGNSTGPHLHFEFRQKTDQGWLAMDAGQLLQEALAQLTNGFRNAQVPAKPDSEEMLAIKGLRDVGLAMKPASTFYLTSTSQAAANFVQ
ncbi:M23 family metallopeptidase [Oculatella sp. FACHB-28]|uniref:M23 family metallopeptidase n=1 Tax=Oculatella sp. FACHB-28 TaxID=2692845 RepID=UPI001688F18E|nr:M23 family metallopeptidase [Oculatella sp. FACHB-28]MBD1865903.1 M23 family metallopeptidase [Cyanobacteria bacterium FACHB-471]MBD2056945.1 M23 family metallopeptidase [Oculatella sp. FACHB-28]